MEGKWWMKMIDESPHLRHTPVKWPSNGKWTLEDVFPCISYWTRGYSIATLVYQRVKVPTSHEGNVLFFLSHENQFHNFNEAVTCCNSRFCISDIRCSEVASPNGRNRKSHISISSIRHFIIEWSIFQPAMLETRRGFSGSDSDRILHDEHLNVHGKDETMIPNESQN